MPPTPKTRLDDLDTADAKRPKPHLDTSRKPPKPQAKKLFHVTFGLHIKQSLEPQSTYPAYANTIWNHIKQLWSHRAHAQPMQTPSGHCRCKKTQTPSRHEPKTAQTASQKTVSRYLWNPHKTIFGATEHMPNHIKQLLPVQTPSGHCRCKKTQTPSRHEPKTAQTASQKTVSRYLWNPHKTIFGATEHMPSLCKHHLEPQSTCSLCKHHLDPKRHHLDTSRKPPKPQAKKLFHVTFGIFGATEHMPHKTIWNHIKLWSTEHMPSLCKHHLDTADAKRPKHHLDTSRKPPKPQAKKLFHVTFGIHIKQSLEPQSTCPAYANTIWNHIKQLWSHSSHAQPMQTPSGHCRCKKTQTPSRHEPKTAQTASQKTVSRYLWNPHKSNKTIFGATEHKPSLCKHKPMQTPSGHCRCKKTQTPSRHEPKTAQTASQKTVSRYLWNPHKTIFGATEHMPSLCKHHLEPHKTTLEPQSTCPAYANTIWTLQMQKDPNTI